MRWPCDCGAGRAIDELHAPGEGQDGGRHAEADDVGQRIHFAAEIAGGVGHARDAPIQPVQKHRSADGFGGDLEMCGRVRRAPAAASMAPWKRAQDGEKAQKDIAGGEQRRQRIGGARARTAGRRPRVDQSVL